MAERKKSERQLKSQCRKSMEALYEACRCGKIKEIPGLRKKYIQNVEEARTYLKAKA